SLHSFVFFLASGAFAVPCSVCGVAICALHCFGLALLCFMLLCAFSTLRFLLAHVCFMSIALTIEALSHLALWNISLCCIVFVFNVYSIHDAIVRFFGGFGVDYYCLCCCVVFSCLLVTRLFIL